MSEVYTLKFPDRPDLVLQPGEWPKSVFDIDGVTYLELPQTAQEERIRVVRYYRADGYREQIAALAARRTG